MTLKWIKIGIIFLSGCIAFSLAQAATGNGSRIVWMNGEINDAACNIAMESRDQVIDMGISIW